MSDAERDIRLEDLLADCDAEESSSAASSRLKKKPRRSPLSFLNKLSITGNSEKMKLKMLSDLFVMKGIAILGQWTTIYAAPNTGKTLLTLWLLREQIEAGVISGENVYYVNADDNYRGLVEKTEFAESWGLHMVAPNHNEFKTAQIPVLMGMLAEADEASGVIIVLDTLKKFTDLMDKRAATTFGLAARGFVSAGGTLICLAHTNKHKDVDGKGVYSGTSDIVDDSDCTFIVDQIDCSENAEYRTHTVEFVNKKMRGDVESTEGFEFKRCKGQKYIELLNSVKRIGSHDIAESRQRVQVEKRLEEDANIVSAIHDCISAGTTTKAKIISDVKDGTAESHARIRRVLEKRTGDDYALGDRWISRPGNHNAQVYAVLPTLFKTI